MEQSEEIRGISISFLGKKKKSPEKTKEIYKFEDSDKSFLLSDTSADISFENNLSLDEKTEDYKIQLYGFDNIKIRPFLNDKIKPKNSKKTIKNYYKMKNELGSDELAKLYLIDFNRLMEQKNYS